MPAVTFILAFIAVLALIGAAAWLVRRFAGNRLGANTNRGRMPRLAVIDAAAVDGRRRLVLVRRDNVEHLLMIGGPTDIVVEPNIVRAIPGRDQMAQRPAAAVGSIEPPRIAPLPDPANWSDEAVRAENFDHHPEPQMAEPPPRPVRPAFADEVRRQPPAMAERRPDRLADRMPDRLPERSPERIDRSERSDPLGGFASEPMSPRPEPRVDMRSEPMTPPPPRLPRAEPMMPRVSRPIETPKAPPPMPIRAERPAPPPPPPVPPPAPTPAPSMSAPPMSSADQNLAEMAQRLEAALRRPVEPSEPRIGAPPVAPEPPPSRPAPRIEAVAPPPPPPAPPPPVKSGFENLEDEMASLLGRPKSSS